MKWKCSRRPPFRAACPDRIGACAEIPRFDSISRSDASQHASARMKWQLIPRIRSVRVMDCQPAISCEKEAAFLEGGRYLTSTFICDSSGFPQLAKQRFPGERLGQQGDFGIGQPGMREAGIAGHIHHFHLRSHGGQFGGQVLPVHSGHHHVGEQQVDRWPPMPQSDLDGRLGRFRLQHRVAAVFQ